jgi:hypothetical protein
LSPRWALVSRARCLRVSFSKPGGIAVYPATTGTPIARTAYHGRRGDRGGGAVLRDTQRAAPRAQRVAAAGESGIIRPGPRPGVPGAAPGGISRAGSAGFVDRSPARAVAPGHAAPGIPTVERGPLAADHTPAFAGMRGGPAESGPADVARPLRGARRRNDRVRRARFQRPRRALQTVTTVTTVGFREVQPLNPAGRCHDRPNLDRRSDSAVHTRRLARCADLATCAGTWEGDEWTRRSAE